MTWRSRPRSRPRPGWRYISGLTDPQGLRAFKCPCSKALIRWPFQHSWCSWAKPTKPIKIKAARTHPATTFFIMAATPRGDRAAKDDEPMGAAVNAPQPPHRVLKPADRGMADAVAAADVDQG